MVGDWFLVSWSVGVTLLSRSSKHEFWRYLSYAASYRGRIVVIVVAGIAVFVLPMLSAFLVKLIADRVIPERDMSLLAYVAVGLLVSEAVRAAAFQIRGNNMVRLNSDIIFDLRQDLWNHLQRLSLNFHQSRPTGSLLSRLIGDVNEAQQMVSGGMINVFIEVFCGAVALAILLTIDWRMTLVLIAILPLFAWLYRGVNPKIRELSRSVREQNSVLSGSAVERLAGIAVVQSFAQERAEADTFAQQSETLKDHTVERGKLNTLLKSYSNFLTRMGGYSLWMVGAIIAVTRGSMTVGDIILFTAVAGHLYRPIQRLSEVNIVYQNSMAAIERIFQLFDQVPEVVNQPKFREMPPLQGEVRFDRVTFRYSEGDRPALDDVSFVVHPGQRTAVVGESGAGKSTLVTLIPRLFDVSDGAILIDGRDARDYPLRKLRRNVGIVLQDTVLFSGTVRENLQYGNKNATNAKIVEAAQAAHAHEFITELPEGYDTVIGERGLNLSGGQRQRLSIARTILQDPKVLIMDEATSALDSESENLITAALDHVLEGRTSLIIAHRLSTILSADNILVFRRGKLVEQGPHEDLLAKNGYYKSLYERQFGSEIQRAAAS